MFVSNFIPAGTSTHYVVVERRTEILTAANFKAVGNGFLWKEKTGKVVECPYILYGRILRNFATLPVFSVSSLLSQPDNAERLISLMLFFNIILCRYIYLCPLRTEYVVLMVLDSTDGTYRLDSAPILGTADCVLVLISRCYDLPT